VNSLRPLLFFVFVLLEEDVVKLLVLLVESGGEGLLLLGDLGIWLDSLPLGLNEIGLLLVSLLFGDQLSSAGSLGVGVELDQESEVLEWVLLVGVDLLLGDLVSENGLDFIGVDDSGNIGVGEDGSGELVVDLLGGSLLVSSVDLVESLESVGSPNDESSKVTSWGELQQVQSGNAGKFNTGQVSESLGERGLVVVDHEWTSPLNVSSVSHLSLSGSESLGVLDFLNIRESIEGFEEGNSLGGLVDVIDGLVVDDQRNLRDLLDSVTSGQNQRGESRSSESGGQSEPLLSHGDLSVPPPPSLGWGEHPSSSAHVSIGSLARSASTTSSNTRNTSDGTTSSPRFGRSLMTGIFGNRVSLSLVLCHSGVNILNNVGTDGGGEDSRQCNVFHCWFVV